MLINDKVPNPQSIFFLCVGVFSQNVFMCTTWVPDAVQRSEEGAGYPQTRVSDDYESLGES